MSDEPSDAQKLIAEVIGDHRYDISDVHVHRCVCGADIGRDPDALDIHRGVEVDKALGGLTQKWAAHYIGDGELVTECAKWQALRCAAAQPQTVRAESYFVSGWTVVTGE
ncbi:Uncharacterised protein [Mycobacteroides abscessus subsp. massiliense]|nr:Uncharacterised protein [Mycobacteroides abscessus subsp. massiliense]